MLFLLMRALLHFALVSRQKPLSLFMKNRLLFGVLKGHRLRLNSTTIISNQPKTKTAGKWQTKNDDCIMVPSFCDQNNYANPKIQYLNLTNDPPIWMKNQARKNKCEFEIHSTLTQPSCCHDLKKQRGSLQNWVWLQNWFLELSVR